MIDLSLDDIRDKLGKHIIELTDNFPNSSVLDGLTREELNALLKQTTEQVLEWLKAVDEDCKQLEATAKAQIAQKKPAEFVSAPKGSYDLYGSH